MAQNINIQDYTLDTGNDKEATQNNLKTLNDKLNTISREVTSWDFYNIQTVLTDIEGFSSAINELNNNSSLMIDTNPFMFNNIQYHRGDLIFKKDNKTTLIKSERGGVYYPSRIERESNNNNNFIFYYSFLQYEPQSEKEIEITPTGNVWQIGDEKSRNYKFLDLSIKDVSLTYGEVFIREEGKEFQFSINLKKKNNQYISPIIKYYIKKENDHFEEIICEPKIEITSTTDSAYMTISLIPSIVNKVVVK